MQQGKSFSDAFAEARDCGWLEDSVNEDDLLGIDVSRKLLILLHTMGKFDNVDLQIEVRQGKR